MKKIFKHLSGLLPVMCFMSGAQGAALDGMEFRPYGFIKLSTLVSSSGVGSSNAFNQAASTQASPHLKNIDDDSRLTFQAQQSRIGFLISRSKEIQGKFEFDFVDSAKASPTVQMNPRVRVAAITINQDDYKIIIGQDWDLFSPMSPYSFNSVGNYFMNGNIGFFRQQIQYLSTKGKIDYGMALGLAGPNASAQDTDLEISKSPSYTGRIAYLLENGKIGISGLYTNYKYETVQGPRRDSFGISPYFEKKWGTFELRSEVYYGQNLANTGANALGRGTNDTNAKELGGFVSFYKALEQFDLFGGAGIARITNPQEIKELQLNANNTVTNPGALSNSSIRIGLRKEIFKDVDLLSELTRYETKYKLATGKQINEAYVIETGVRLTF